MIDFKNLTEQQIISYHLDLLHQYDDRTVVFSSLTAALRDARQNTGRDIATGIDINPPENSQAGNWLGAICYLIILDQLGKCYKGVRDPDYLSLTPIHRSLKYFTQLPDAVCYAIYALRNALTHDYSISNPHKNNPLLRHHFTLHEDFSVPIVKLPKVIWDGNPDNKTHENMTHISLPGMANTVEQIHKTIVELHNKSELAVILQGGAKEIKNRYLLFRFVEKN